MSRLRQLRHEREISAARLAAMVGCHPSHIQQIERGKNRPSPWLLARLAEALGVPVSELQQISPQGAGM